MLVLKNMDQKSKQLLTGSIRGFTLLELLIVIGILAILATAAVLVLNPSELLEQARDSTRVADLNSMHKSLGIYMSSIKTPNMDNGYGHCKSGASATKNVYSYLEGATSSIATFPYTATTSKFAASSSPTRAVDGTGWLPINLNSMVTGSPLSKIPVDPVNATSTSSSTTFVYIYGCDDAKDAWVITARLESEKYITTLGIPSKDGGPDNGYFEVGNSVGLTIN